MRNARQLLLLVGFAGALLCAACSNEDPSKCSTPEREEDLASEAWSAAQEDANYCEIDSDCGLYLGGRSCASSCGTPLNRSEFEQLYELSVELEDRVLQCEGGCPVPFCAPRACEPVTICVESRCQIAACPPTGP